MNNSFCILTISYDYSDELLITIASIKKLSNSIRKVRLNYRFGYFLVISKVLTTKQRKNIKRIFNDDFDSIEIVEQNDRGIYDAMNLGVKTAFSKEYKQLLFINSGSEITNEFNVKNFLDLIESKNRYIKLFSAIDYVPYKNRKIKIFPLNIKSWIQKPYIMPTVHQAIVFPIDYLKKYPYIAFKGMLASDYIHLLQLITLDAKFIRSGLVITKYVNNGVSSLKPYKSIIQRYAGFYMIFGNLFLSIRLTIFWLLKTFLARLIGMR